MSSSTVHRTTMKIIVSRLLRSYNVERSLPTEQWTKARSLHCRGNSNHTTVNDLFLASKACFISEDTIFTAIYHLHSAIELSELQLVRT